MSYNIEGLGIIYQPDVRAFLSDYDVIFLTETFSIDFPTHLFPTYLIFTSPGIKLSDGSTARLSGGVALLIKRSFANFVKPIHVEYDNCIVLKVSREMTGLATDCVIIGMYLPPSQSDYYSETDIDNGICLLEQCLLDVYEDHGEIPLIILGDLNARTGSANAKDYVLPDTCLDEDTEPDKRFTRKSKDCTTNDFGRYLLSVCEQFSLLIMNGLLPGDEYGDVTYIAHNGASVIDYVLLSRCLFECAIKLRILPRIDSKHLPVEFIFDASEKSNTIRDRITTVEIEKYRWNQEKADEYCHSLLSNEISFIFDKATDLIDVDIEAALDKFNEGIILAAQCMKRTFKFGNKIKNSPWFDAECRKMRSDVRLSLRKYTKFKDKQDGDSLRIIYTEKRKQYKQVLKQKRLDHKKDILETLEKSSSKDSRKFWGTIKSSMYSGSPLNTISSEDWLDHFKKVFDSEFIDEGTAGTRDIVLEEDLANNQFQNIDIDITVLDAEITECDVKDAIKALKNEKAAGPDGLSGEFYKYSAPCIVTFLTKMFNKLFDSGTFPLSWSESVIHPIHKKGDINSPDNYRGISLLNVSSKLYSYILNKRLTDWVEENNVLNESQAGFRRNYSTVDHIYCLLTLVQKQLSNHQKLYAAFVDFKKAFDFVDRKYLWFVLRKNGIRGKMYKAIKSMYEIVKARVRANNCVSESFMCPRGLKQGENCSPILFSLFINELADEITQNGRHGIALTPELIEILIMLFADDVVLLSYTVVGLQRQLDILSNTARRLDLTVNREKSKIVIFRNGGHIASTEKWFYSGEKLEIVNEYKYLGIIFSTRLTFSYSLEEMAMKARKGVFCILKFLWSLGKNCPKLFFKMFDCQIQPMLTYGSEVWGLSADHTAIERVHLFAIKRLLNISIKTPTALIYCETGRHPLYIQTYTRCIKYWLKITRMEETRIPKKAYKMLYGLHCKDKKNWASDICFTLYRYGFGYVWENQGVQQVNNFVSVFRQRLHDCHIQDLNCTITSKERYTLYSTFKQLYDPPHYLNEIHNPGLRKWLTRVRLGVSPLRPHITRYSKKRENINCPFCDNVKESEMHVLLICPNYNDLRMLYIPEKYYVRPNAFKLALLLADAKHCTLLAIFLTKAFSLRHKLMS